MIPAALLVAALAPGAEPAAAHDVLLTVGDRAPVRVRLRIDLDGQPLAARDAAAKQTRAALDGKPGAAALDRLTPDGSLLRAEATSAAPHPAALTRALAAALDTNRDGTVSADELADADARLLRRFDLDDDECVTPLELVPDLQTVVPDGRPAPAVRVAVVPAEGKADLEHAVRLGRTATFWRGRVGAVWVEIHARPGLPSERPATPKVLLTPGREAARAAFEATAAGVVSLAAVPGPVGWFDRLDADRDGQLSVAELRRAKAVLAGASVRDAGVSLVLTPGAAGPPAVPLARTLARTAGPAWFRATDRNGDGFVSPREFPGTPDQFRKLDADGDGLIDPAEAAAATPPEPKGTMP